MGDVDEVRISGVARSADWVQLEYENQKPMQTLVGPVVQDGDEFSLSPSSKQAYYTSAAKDAIALEFDQPVVWKNSLVSEFRLNGARGNVASGVVSGNVLTLKLKEPIQARKITYLDEMAWSQDRLLIGKNGIAALTFCDVPVLDERKTK